jgi:predicted DsbA family dithiol-disulfide isomerase
MTPRLRLWVDPGCPWAWQTARWLRDLRDREMFTIEWRLFSLEVNSASLDTPFAEAADRYGESLMALSLARREQGEDAFEAYYAAIGAILHDQGEAVSSQVARRAADDANMPGLVDRAVADPTVAENVVQEYREAREVDVFGVPTLQLDDALPIYGPILPEAPAGDDAMEWWSHVSWLIGRDDLYELKRWPRPRRPPNDSSGTRER